MRTLDKQDAELLAYREIAYNTHNGPRVGDYVQMLDGSLQRFSHDWGDDIQTTDGKYGASFYISKNGYVEMSGGLNKAILKSTLELLPETKEGSFWFFRHDLAMAHNGVDVKIVCRIYKQLTQ